MTRPERSDSGRSPAGAPPLDFRGDERAVSVTLTQVFALGVASLLVLALLASVGSFVGGERDRVAREGLETVANRLADEITRVDALVDGGATATLRTDHVRRVAGSAYRVTLRGGGCSAGGAGACLRLAAVDRAVSVAVPVRNRSPVEIDRAAPGEFEVTVRGTGGDAGDSGVDLETNLRMSIGRDVSDERSGSDTVVVANRNPISGFTVSPGLPVAGEPITFRNDTSDADGDIVSYDWDLKPAPGFEATGPNFTYTYSEPGLYNVTLTVTDDDGATDSVTKLVAVSGLAYNDDATAVDLDGDGVPGGLAFSLTNLFNASLPGFDDDTVRITDVLVDPANDTGIDRLDPGSATPPYDHELYVDTDTRDGHAGSTAGLTIPDGGQIIDVDEADDGREPEIDGDGVATVSLSEFRPALNMTGERVTIAVRYLVDGEYFTSRFEVTPTGSTVTTLLAASFEGSGYDLPDYGFTHNRTDSESAADVGFGTPSSSGCCAAYKGGRTSFFGGAPPGGGAIEMADAVNTSRFENVSIRYWIQEGEGSDGPNVETGADAEDLLVEYWDGDDWVTIQRHDATTSDGASTARTVRTTLDGSGVLHDDFKIRFYQINADDADRWYVDDVRIEGRS
jgi:PKD repeat protein